MRKMPSMTRRHLSIATRLRVLAPILGLLILGSTLDSSKSATAATPTGQLKILALGDSYTAGNGAGSYYGDSTCYRSLKNYANQFAAKVGAVSDVGACSGAVANDFFVISWGRKPMIEWVDTSYDVIFVTIGGNDLNFSSAVQHCFVGSTRRWDSCTNDINIATVMLANGTIYNRISLVLANIRARAAAHAKIVLVGYPYMERDPLFKLYSPNRKTVVNVGTDIRALGDWIDRVENQVVADLNASPGSAGLSPFVFQSVISKFDSPIQHELAAGGALRPAGVAGRWMMAPVTDSPVTDLWYHPNIYGWNAEADLLFANPRIPHTPYVAPPPPPPTCPAGQIGTPPNCTTPPPPPTCPAGQIGTPPNCTTPPPPPPTTWVEKVWWTSAGAFSAGPGAGIVSTIQPTGTLVTVDCRAYNLAVATSNTGGWWYHLVSPFAGQWTPASLYWNDPTGTALWDPAVRVC